MPEFNFDLLNMFDNNLKPCIRININDPNDIVEYPSIRKAADDIVYNAMHIRVCCKRNLGLRQPRYRIKNWYFIYK